MTSRSAGFGKIAGVVAVVLSSALGSLNAMTASLVGAMLVGETIRWHTVLGLVMVAAGIRVATHERPPCSRMSSSA
jgi:hypothetical protein